MTSLVIAAARGELESFLAAEASAVRRGVLSAIQAQTNATKEAARSRVRAAFGTKGNRLAGAVRGKVYENDGFNAAGLVYSKAGRRESGTFIDLLAPFTTGATITPRRAKWLYIAIDPRFKRRRRAAVTLDPRRFAFVMAPGGGRIWIIERTRGRSKLVALLVRQVTLPRRLEVESLDTEAADALPKRIVAALDEAHH